MDFTPPNLDYAEAVRASFANQAMMASLGATLETVTPGKVTLALPFNADFGQQHGYLHAGAIASVLDSACGYAAFSLIPEGAEILTIEFKTNLLAPASAKRFDVSGQVIKPGRRIMVAEAKAESDDRRLIATMTATLIVMPARQGASDAAH
ncbi:PaaI family thioesterase [Oceanibium sediminis]|uniref:PaaI family thioesterase n=1 Tax=Oceanibium sediminis TaxID=2026339 RepID=UPI000DD333F8|nr:PaaI family thioesterase [Oceanibium sediminis]